VPLKDLAMGVMMGASDTDTVSSLAGRLARLNKQLDKHDHARIAEKSGGVAFSSIVSSLIAAIDGDNVEAKALELAGQPAGTDPGDTNRDKGQAQAQLVKAAANVFTGDLIELIDSIRRDKEQKLNHDHVDKLITAGWAQDAQEKAETLTQEFAAWMQAHQDEFIALTIFYAEPFRRREVTFAMLEQVLTALRADAPRLAPLRVYQAYQHLDETKAKTPLNDLTALVSLIRRACGVDAKLTAFDDVVRKNFQHWIMAKHNEPGPKFTEAQVHWLNMIRDHMTTSFHLDRDDLELAPFDSQGGLGTMYQLFGERMDAIMDELNEALVA
jgi:type I restriction enzyme R subunit